MALYKNKYRSESNRLKGWVYSWEGSYFITVCTANRECLFGEIINARMIMSDAGNIVQQEWDKSFMIRAELFCDEYVIMPNHIHAILRIDNGAIGFVETHGRAALQNHGIALRQPKSISSFIAGFKSSATKRINELHNTPHKPVWQSRYHDHIIRNHDEYYRIRQYINENRRHWDKDKFFI